ncbi:MAG: outer membrane protein TolC [Saprospiraceae bacterium]|jgi:outer membrane protein TolC
MVLWTILTSAVSGNTDSLSLPAYLEMIGSNYPLIKKANLFDEFSEAYTLKGRGVLDAKINSDFETKNFAGSNYFTVWQTELKVPTRLPLDFSFGYENNSGDFLNEESSVPSNGLFYGTINLSLVRGLMFDEQRYSMQSAELKGIKSQIDKDVLTREILFQAIQSYLGWAAAFHKNTILENFRNNVQARHQFVVELYINGDKPAIDTIESTVNLNTATKIYLDSENDLAIKKQKLVMFLWDENGNPLDLNNTVRPEAFTSLLLRLGELATIENAIFSNDPSLRKLENEMDQLKLNNRIEREYLKPRVDLKYNTLVNLGKENFSPSLSLNDYKYGIKVEVPIQNRKTRGELRLNQALVDQVALEQLHYQQQLNNKYMVLTKTRFIQEDIMDVVIEKIDNSNTLYYAEVLKFDLGESSVFLLNQRERKLLEARMEMIKSYYSLSSILNDLYFLKIGQ